MGITLGACVRTAWMERRGLALRRLRHLAEHFGRTGLVIPHGSGMSLIMVADRLEQPQRADTDDIGGIFRLVERNTDVRLRGEIVDFVGADLLDDPANSGGVAKIAVMQAKSAVSRSESLAQMVNPAG